MFDCIAQDSLALRRSVYDLGDMPIISDACVIDTISECLKNCPTPYNVQSARVVVLLKKYHKDFWDLVWKNMEKTIAEEKLNSARNKIDSFSQAYGTILFFEDTLELNKLKRQFPLYKNNMHDWIMQANGMLQYMIWQLLAENDEGASLQHYNELIEGQVNEWLNLPKSWKIVAQMPWGSIEKEPKEKQILPLENRLKIFR